MLTLSDQDLVKATTRDVDNNVSTRRSSLSERKVIQPKSCLRVSGRREVDFWAEFINCASCDEERLSSLVYSRTPFAISVDSMPPSKGNAKKEAGKARKDDKKVRHFYGRL